VLNVSDIFYRNCARSNHVQKRSIFAFCSPLEAESRSLVSTNSAVSAK
jgi:hypothetical protein